MENAVPASDSAETGEAQVLQPSRQMNLLQNTENAVELLLQQSAPQICVPPDGSEASNQPASFLSWICVLQSQICSPFIMPNSLQNLTLLWPAQFTLGQLDASPIIIMWTPKAPSLSYNVHLLGKGHFIYKVRWLKWGDPSYFSLYLLFLSKAAK